MSKPAFTPGPLIVVETKAYFAVKPANAKLGKGQYGRTVANCPKPHPTAMADATLYAAAPAMYEALIELTAEDGNAIRGMALALAALAQAEGREQ